MNRKQQFFDSVNVPPMPRKQTKLEDSEARADRPIFENEGNTPGRRTGTTKGTIRGVVPSAVKHRTGR